MSREIEYEWQLQRELRRQEFLNRVRDTTSQFYYRYVGILQDLAQQGLDQYIPAEFARAQYQLDVVAGLLNHDPEQARNLNRQLGPVISRLPVLARSVRQQLAQREREQRTELFEMQRATASELDTTLRDAVAGVADPVARDFAFDAMRAIAESFRGRSDLSGLRQRVDAAVREATQRATAWKAERQQESRAEAQAMLVAVHEEALQRESERHPEAVAAPLETLAALRRALEAGPRDQAELEAALTASSETADAAVVDEACRRRTVIAVLAALQGAGFVTAAPELQDDEVLIAARKPAGAEAEFRVTAEGGMHFKFDGYAGMKCKDDIDQILPLLQQAYGIELSNERVLWENPVRISADEIPLPNTGSIHHE